VAGHDPLTTTSDVLDQMIEAGMPETPEQLEVTGRLRRFGRKKRGWYRLHENIGRTGRAYITGSFGYWGLIDGQRIRPPQSLDQAELERLRELAAARRAREDRVRREAAERAALQSSARWRAGARAGASSYLVRKLIAAPESLRFEPDGTLLVPMVRYDLPREAALVGVQSIKADGEKRFARGTAKRGAACRIGVVVVGEPILVGEGYATCMTLRAAVSARLPVFVAFDAGNLEPVVEVLQAAHPQCPILVCADDDYATSGNPGRAKADRLRRRNGVHMIYPVWPPGASRGPKDTDFNDLHKCAGLHVVARQLRAPLRYLGYTGPLAAEITDAA